MSDDADTCPRCAGAGFVEIRYPEDSIIDYFDCDACDGTGRVEPEETSP